MSDFIAVPIFFLLIITTLFFAVLIGRKIFKTGIEHFSGRMLICSGILNAFLCILILFFQTLSNSSLSMSGRLFTGFLVIFIPARVLGNYFRLPQNIMTRFNLTPHHSKSIANTIAALSKSMEIFPPTILSSDSVRTPFVFGRRSSKAYLAVPKQWHRPDNSSDYPILLHELAHIRNHDIGFLAWSQAYAKDLKWMLIFLPILIIPGYLFGYQPIGSSLSIFLVCLMTLYGLLRYILRKRELLADRTAALLVESDEIEQAISLNSTEAFSFHISSTQKFKAGLGNTLHRWLTDKAMFSNHPTCWAAMLRIFDFFRASHPQRSKRIESVLSTSEMAKSQTIAAESFWAGITLGFLGVTIGLCGYWFSGPMNYTPEDVKSLRLSYTLYGLIAPPAVGAWVVFITLPFWASLSCPNMDRAFLKLLLKQHGIAFGGALMVSLLILTAGPFQWHFQVLSILCLLWQLLITLAGFCVSIVSVFLWNVTRYFQASTLNDLKKSLWTLIPLLVVSLGAAFWGMFQISNDKVFQGANLLFSTLVGLAILLKTMGQSRFSQPDRYMTIPGFFFTYRIEGKKFLQQHKPIDIVAIPLLLLSLILLCYMSVSLLLRDLLDSISTRYAIISLMIIGCAILILIQLSAKGKLRITRRSKIYRLFHCLKLLSKPQSTECLRKIEQVVNSSGLKDNRFFNPPLNLISGDIYELYQFDVGVKNPFSSLKVSAHEAGITPIRTYDAGVQFAKKGYPELSERAIEWTLQCRLTAGFGLWPQSSPRLISTYQALSILKDSNRLGRINPSKHVFWIKSLQYPDGSFKSPWSQRERWEDTFFAVKSLNILGVTLETDRTDRCCRLCHRLLQEGIVKDRPDMIYYSIGTLDALGQLHEDRVSTISNWLSGKTEKLLLANIGLNYEAIHFTVMTYELLSHLTSLAAMAPHIELLTGRIQTALDAELADIRP